MSSDATALPTYPGTGSSIVISGSILGLVTTIVVGLRFWARKLTKQRFGLDDWLCLAALIFQHAVMIASCVGAIHGGLGHDQADVAPGSVVILYQALLVGEIGYTFSSPLIKLSVLFFYRRIFPTSTVRVGSLIIGSICIAWFIPVIILDFIQCRPLKAFWYIQLQALPTTKCFDPVLFHFANSIANSIIDAFTLSLPIREVLKLQTSLRRRINICLVFLLGGLALAASLVRTISTADIIKTAKANFSEQFAISAVASVIEIYAAIVGACLPITAPIYRKIRYGDAMASGPASITKRRTAGVSSNGQNNITGAGHTSKPNISYGMFKRITEVDEPHEFGSYQRDHQVNISSQVPDIHGYSDAEYCPLEGVMVRHDTEVRNEHNTAYSWPVR